MEGSVIHELVCRVSNRVKDTLNFLIDIHNQNFHCFNRFSDFLLRDDSPKNTNSMHSVIRCRFGWNFVIFGGKKIPHTHTHTPQFLAKGISKY